MLAAVADAWQRRRDEVNRSADEMRHLLAESATLRAAGGTLDPGVPDRAYRFLARRSDARFGGWGAAPKFPQPMTLEFLLRYWHRTGNAGALRMAEHTLDRMHTGGIYDHLGGGFHRYSTDARWLVPHFEKMLYDNALVPLAYLHAFQATGREPYRKVVTEVLRYVEREMLGPEGEFFSAQDADSDGEEGRFYVWTAEEVDRVLGPDDAPLFRRFYDVTEAGNWEGNTILHANHAPEAFAAAEGVDADRLDAVLRRCREALYAVRAERVWPGRDDKVLTAWNAMMLHTFAEAAWTFADPRLLRIASNNAEFLLRALRPAGKLLRTYKGGRAKIPAFLEDHALLALYGATGDVRWVREGRGIAEAMLDGFWDEGEGVFWDTARDAEALVVHPRDIWDSATPSGNSAAVFALLRLGALLGEDRYTRIAVRVLEASGPLLGRAPQGFGHLLGALEFHLSAPQEVAIIGEPGAPDTQALLSVLRASYLPNTVIAIASPSDEEEAAGVVPLLAHRSMREGRATAYVCERFACRQPVTDPAALVAELASVPPSTARATTPTPPAG